MNHDTRLLQNSGSSAPVLAPQQAAGGEGHPASVLHELHRMLRGRYVWAILLGLLGLAGGAYGGWWLAPEPTYRSTGAVRIAPYLPKILHTNEHNQMLPMFESFVQSQARLIRSPRVIELAVQNEAWRAAGQEVSDEAVAQYRQQLQTVASGEFVDVWFIHADAEVATAAVRSALDAYETLHVEQDVRGEEQRLQILEQRRTTLANELEGLRDRVVQIADEYGVDSIKSSYQYKREQLHTIETELKQVQLALTQVAPRPGGSIEGEAAGVGGGAEQSSERPKQPGAEEFARVDPQLEQYVSRRTALRDELLRSQPRFGPQHTRMQELRRNIAYLDERIAQYVEENREQLQEQYVAMAGFGAGGIERLRERERQLQELYDQAKAEADALGRKDLQIDRISQEAAIIEQQLTETRRRIESLNLESRGKERIQIVNAGIHPSEPYQDDRLELAGLGGLGGLTLGVGAVLLIGFLDQRFQTPDDARHGLSRARLLGILPHLPDDLSEPDQAALASHSVHHIRALLQLGVDRDGDRAFTITSPGPGDGKTSLSLALGLSFAETGARVLLIDCDLTGHGLSSRTQMIVRRKIGRVLQREGLITHEQLTQALTLASGSGRRLGEVLVELGYLSEDQLHEALGIQEANALGLMDAMAGEPLDACIAETGTANLHMLPVGSAEADHAAKLSTARLRELLAAARDQFDLVLVDTGPVGGSLEASLVAAETDAVLLVVSRGAHRSQVAGVVTQLQTIGSKLAGVVFNRADHQDFSKYAHSSLSRSAKSPPQPAAEATPGAAVTSRFGPVAGAVSGRVHTTNGNGNGSTAPRAAEREREDEAL